MILSPQLKSTFVPNRLIHPLDKVGVKKRGLVALKLDISKTYDKVKWNFVKCTMQKLGFSIKWVNLIMNCISVKWGSVLINGVAKGLIHPQRGLR